MFQGVLDTRVSDMHFTDRDAIEYTRLRAVADPSYDSARSIACALGYERAKFGPGLEFLHLLSTHPQVKSTSLGHGINLPIPLTVLYDGNGSGGDVLYSGSDGRLTSAVGESDLAVQARFENLAVSSAAGAAKIGVNPSLSRKRPQHANLSFPGPDDLMEALDDANPVCLIKESKQRGRNFICDILMPSELGLVSRAANKIACVQQYIMCPGNKSNIVRVHWYKSSNSSSRFYQVCNHVKMSAAAGNAGQREKAYCTQIGTSNACTISEVKGSAYAELLSITRDLARFSLGHPMCKLGKVSGFDEFVCDFIKGSKENKWYFIQVKAFVPSFFVPRPILKASMGERINAANRVNMVDGPFVCGNFRAQFIKVGAANKCKGDYCLARGKQTVGAGAAVFEIPFKNVVEDRKAMGGLGGKPVLAHMYISSFYYDQIKVCAECFRVYSTKSNARMQSEYFNGRRNESRLLAAND